MRRQMDKVKNIRNMSVIAHVDHVSFIYFRNFPLNHRRRTLFCGREIKWVLRYILFAFRLSLFPGPTRLERN